jgi:beta-galactosidase
VSVTADGVVCLAWEVDAARALPAPLAPGLRPSLPRVGLHGRCPKGLQQVVWYGMGPHECYADRQASARLAQHSL